MVLLMDVDLAYQQALDYLYSFVDYSLTRAFRNSPEKFDLGRMERLLERLGNPHKQYKVIHLAGTKGKGSTAAMIFSALQAAGYRVGFYTSPHLVNFNERIQINNKLIPHERIVALVDQLKPHAEFIHQITTFELTTAMAFQYFFEEKVDIAVIEVGMGGRVDSTNLVDPIVSVITSISYDHMAVLGNTLTSIATEKAGIIKPERPVVSSPQKEEALEVIQKIAAGLHSPLTLVGMDYLFKRVENSLDGQSFMVWNLNDQPILDKYLMGKELMDWEPLTLEIPLLGLHQIENAATAYAAIDISRKVGVEISNHQIREGFKNVFWPCRFEVINRSPFLVIDSAHNRDSSLRLRQAIEDYLPGIPVILVFGASEDKDIEGMFAELLPGVKHLIATESTHPRALRADALVELARHYGCPAEAIVPVGAALEKALNLAGKDAAVVVAGSLFVAAAVRETWEKMGKPIKTFEVAQAKDFS
jgi:dihydrofolate synthase / folylpolyglutamate synthase